MRKVATSFMKHNVKELVRFAVRNGMVD